MTVKFVIPGIPKGKGRPRFSRQGQYVKTRTPEDTLVYENLVKTVYYQQCKNQKFDDNAMLDARVIAYYSIPTSVSKKKKSDMLAHKIRPTKKPDADNVEKIIFDSLNLIAFHDDSQIVDCQFRKFYSENPRVVVTISEYIPE